MASFAATSTSLPRQLANGVSNPVQCFSNGRRSNLSFTIRTRFSVSCAAKPETVDKVCAVVKKQLSLKETDKVVAETAFADLGADSLDTVEIVMGLEEAFGIEVVEDKAQNITTVEKAAELIDELLAEKKA